MLLVNRLRPRYGYLSNNALYENESPVATTVKGKADAKSNACTGLDGSGG